MTFLGILFRERIVNIIIKNQNQNSSVVQDDERSSANYTLNEIDFLGGLKSFFTQGYQKKNLDSYFSISQTVLQRNIISGQLKNITILMQNFPSLGTTINYIRTYKIRLQGRIFTQRGVSQGWRGAILQQAFIIFYSKKQQHSSYKVVLLVNMRFSRNQGGVSLVGTNVTPNVGVA